MLLEVKAIIRKSKRRNKMVTSVQFQVSSLPGLWLPNSPSCRRFSTSPISATPTLSSQSSTIQIIGVKGHGLSENGYVNPNSNNTFDGYQGETDLWTDIDTDLYHWTKVLRRVQWFPGHIAKAEKELKEQLKLMDVVIEVRDGRIPLSTSHPQMDRWLGNKKRILVLNREDMISTADRNAWAEYFTTHGTKVVFSNGQLGMGTMKLGRLAKELAADVNVKRRAKGLLPRAVRAGIVGYPNVGKSSLINRLLKWRMCSAAPRPGVTRELRWIRFGKDLELLDSPGILPMRISDQSAAIKLAICDDIGERSYDVDDVAAILVQMLTKLPTVGRDALCKRYKIRVDSQCGKTFIEKLALHLFNGDVHQAAYRVLSDFRKGRFGWTALERPPR
ncbi:DAR GTPase 3, chloroplastic [Cicer arietinum]|uniref:DAR GTPase 3, chloroplastic n=1 Tax=Cicer arietinum TaxID=3827 RepID=A0A1S3EBA8_CICAR|nr:DAR GTPase 3, chloroplastic [Cicer arietinum]